jgi:hypothetical protein
MPFECYIGYLHDDAQRTKPEIAAGEPLTLEVRDLDTFERLVVRALVSAPPARLDGGDELWVLDYVEARQPAPWSIRVLEELDEEAAAQARSDVSDADRNAPAEELEKYGGKRYRGAQMPEMMGQEEARKYYQNVVAKKPAR